MKKNYQTYRTTCQGNRKQAILFAVMLAACVTFLSACSQKQPVEPELTAAVSIATTEATETILETTAQDTMGSSLVTDAYFSDAYTDANGNPCYYHIPQINLNLPGIQEINRNIYDSLYNQILSVLVFDMPTPMVNGVAYTWSVHGDYLSVLTCIRITEGDELIHTTINVNMKTGEIASLEELMDLCEIEVEYFFPLVQIMIDGELVSMNQGLDEDLIEKNFAMQLSKSLSQENLLNTQYYLDGANGELCIIANLFDIYGQSAGQHRIAVASADTPVNPFAYRDLSQRWE